MSNIHTINLLIIEKNTTEADRWVHLFKQANYKVTAACADSEKQLRQKLTERQWDLVLIKMARDIPIITDQALQTIQHHDDALPCILVYTGSLHGGIVHWMEKGIADAISVKMPERVIVAARKAQELLNLKRNHAIANIPFKDIAFFEQMILDSAQLGVIRVDQQHIVYANLVAAKLCGFPLAKHLLNEPVNLFLKIDGDTEDLNSIITKCQQRRQLFDFEQAVISQQNGQHFMTRLVVIPSIDHTNSVVAQLILESEKVAIIDQLLHIQQPPTENLLENLEFYQHTISTDQKKWLQNSVDHINAEPSCGFAFAVHIESLKNVSSQMDDRQCYRVMEQVAAVMNRILLTESLIVKKSNTLFAFWFASNKNNTIENKVRRLSNALENIVIQHKNISQQLATLISVVEFDQSVSVKSLLHQSELALEQARRKGLNSWHLFQPEDDINIRSQKGDIISMVQCALDQNRTFICFQPVAPLQGDYSEHYEVLLRIKTEDYREIPAQQFIDTVEKHPEIAGKLDRWIFINAIKAIMQKLKENRDVNLFVHITQTSLQDKQFPAWLYAVIKKSAINPKLLIIELGEEMLIDYPQASLRLISSLNKIGCRVSLCRFGTSVAPIQLASQFVSHFIKMHPDLTATPSNDEARLKQCIQTLRQSGRKVIISHVETPSRLTLAWRLKADYVQGYFLQQPQLEMKYTFCEF